MARQLRILIVSALFAWGFGLGLVALAVYAGPAATGIALMFSAALFLLAMTYRAAGEE